MVEPLTMWIDVTVFPKRLRFDSPPRISTEDAYAILRPAKGVTSALSNRQLIQQQLGEALEDYANPITTYPMLYQHVLSLLAQHGIEVGMGSVRNSRFGGYGEPRMQGSTLAAFMQRESAHVVLSSIAILIASIP